MPTYPYQCSQCKTSLDLFCDIPERDTQVCPTCGRALVRQFAHNTHGIQSPFKEDWYWFKPQERVLISSKRQLLDECKRRGKVSIGYG